MSNSSQKGFAQKLAKQLEIHEGIRLRPYKDTVGKLTIGVGRNLTDKGISQEEAMTLLYNDIHEVLEQLDENLPWWKSLNSVRRLVLADMCFNLGVSGLLSFKNTLAAAKVENFELASRRMLASKWARQVGKRAERLAEMMRTGKEGEA